MIINTACEQDAENGKCGTFVLKMNESVTITMVRGIIKHLIILH